MAARLSPGAADILPAVGAGGPAEMHGGQHLASDCCHRLGILAYHCDTTMNQHIKRVADRRPLVRLIGRAHARQQLVCGRQQHLRAQIDLRSTSRQCSLQLGVLLELEPADWRLGVGEECA